MHEHHQLFLDAIASRRRLSLRFFDKKQQKERTATCAALDYGPLRGATDGLDRYQLWDLDAKRPPYNVALLEGDVRSMTLLDETFEPADIIKWAFKPGAWHTPRDWGAFS